jgi:hypothetical protein
MLLRSANLKRVPEGSVQQPPDIPRPPALLAANRFFVRLSQARSSLPLPVARRRAGLLICNRTSFLDPQLIQAVCRG